MTKKISALFVTALFVSSVIPALAIDLTPTPSATITPKPTSQETRKEYKTIIKNLVKDIKDVRVKTNREVKEIKTESRDEVKEGRTMLKSTITQTRLDQNKKRIAAVYQGLFSNFARHLDVLKNYQIRIQTKVTAKKVTLPTNQSLIDAQSKLDNVTNVLIPKFTADQAALKTKIESVSSSTDPKILVPELKSLSKAVEQDLKTIRQQLVEALRLMVKAK